MGNGKDKNNPTKVVEVGGTPPGNSAPSYGPGAIDPTPDEVDSYGVGFNEQIYPDDDLEALSGALGGGSAGAGNANDVIEEILQQTKDIDTGQIKPGEAPRSNYSPQDRTGLPTSETNALVNQDGMTFGYGNFGQPSLEPKPTFVALPSETVYDSQVNAQIVVGPYKPVGVLSPSIVNGETRNATIDLVAGRLGAYAATVTKDKAKVEELRKNLRTNQIDLARVIDKLAFEPNLQNRSELETSRLNLQAKYFKSRQKLADLISSASEERVYCNNSYKLDAARVTICQRGDVDEHFGIRPAGVGTSRGSSFVAVKADDVRLIGRSSIKIVTGTDDETSQAGNGSNPRGIDLVAQNDDEDMQLMVKGSNLVACLKDMIKDISDVNGSLVDFLAQQQAYNAMVALHTHNGLMPVDFTIIPIWMPGFVQATCVTFPSLVIGKYNHFALEFKYLTPKPLFKPGGANKYILSKGNRTN